jgi:hypothetical protein
MDPITLALIAGATFVMQGFATEAVKDAYKGLKGLLTGKMSSLANLEEDPKDEDYQKAADKELQKKGLANDPTVLAKAVELTKAIESEPKDKLAKAGIDIGGLYAAGEVIARRLHAAGDVRIKDVRSETGSITIEDISAGTQDKEPGTSRKN